MKEEIAQKQIREEIDREGEFDVVEKNNERVTIADPQKLEQVQPHIRKVKVHQHKQVAVNPAQVSLRVECH